MRKTNLFALLLLALTLISVVGCGNSGDTPNPNAQTPGASGEGTGPKSGSKGGIQPPGV